MSACDRDSYLFLDIDGVLNSERFLYKTKKARDEVIEWNKELRLRHALDPEALGRLTVIMDRCRGEGFNTKIVMSTSWRLQNTVGDFRRAFIANGFSKELALRIIDKTPYRIDGDCTNRRGLEIQQWLDARWGAAQLPGAAATIPPRICILDDSRDFGHLLPHHVLTEWGDGLTDEHIDPCVRLLTLTTYSNLP